MEEEEETRDTNTLMGIRDELDSVWTKLFNLRATTTPSRMTHRIANRLHNTYHTSAVNGLRRSEFPAIKPSQWVHQ